MDGGRVTKIISERKSGFSVTCQLLQSSVQSVSPGLGRGGWEGGGERGVVAPTRMEVGGGGRGGGQAGVGGGVAPSPLQKGQNDPSAKELEE